MAGVKTPESKGRSRATDRLNQQRAKAAKLRLLGSIIRETRGSLTQTELGERMGSREEPIPQSTISRWEKGMVDLTVTQIHDLERVLQVRPGTLLLAAGMIDPGFSSKDVENALRSDPKIHPDFRADVVRFYRSYVDMSARLSTDGHVDHDGNGRRRPRR